MENTAIRPPGSAAPPNPVARNAGARQAQAAGADAADTQRGFSLLLADMAEMGGAAPPALAASADAPEEAPAHAEPQPEAGVFPLAGLSGLVGLASLVGQTARMDGAADAALRDGRQLGDGAGDARPSQVALPMGAGRGAAAMTAPAAGTALDDGWGRVQAAAGRSPAGVASDVPDVKAAVQDAGTLSLQPAERGAQPHGLAALLARMEPEPMPAVMPGLAAAAGVAAAAGTGPAQDSGPATGPGAAAPGTPAADVTSFDAGPVDAPLADAQPGPADDAWADQLSQQVAFWVQQKTQRAEMTIDRQGRPVQVQVTINGSEAHVTFRSSEQQTRDMLDAGAAQLRAMLEQQGLNLASVTVQTADAGGQGASAREQASGRPQASQGVEGRGETGVVSAVVSAGLRARPDAARSVDLFV